MQLGLTSNFLVPSIIPSRQAQIGRIRALPQAKNGRGSPLSFPSEWAGFASP